jgi:hypothetical protein
MTCSSVTGFEEDASMRIGDVMGSRGKLMEGRVIIEVDLTGLDDF